MRCATLRRLAIAPMLSAGRSFLYNAPPMFNWKVLFVKPRTEKKVTEYCELYRIPFYLPLQEKTRVVQRRKVQVMLPLFSGYVFARFDMNQRLPLLQTNLLVRILEPLKPRDLIRDMLMVRRALRVDPTMGAIKPLTRGDKVRIIDGPLMGYSGFVIRVDNEVKVVLNVEMLGQAVPVPVELHQIEPVALHEAETPQGYRTKESQGQVSFHPDGCMCDSCVRAVSGELAASAQHMKSRHRK